MTTDVQKQDFSKIKEVVASWGKIRQFLRSGDEGHLVPVVIPKDSRGFGWLFWVGLAIYLVGVAMFAGNFIIGVPAVLLAILMLLIAFSSWWSSSVVVIEQGTIGIVSSFGRIESTFEPGRHILWMPWKRVEFIVDIATEIPYTAPVLACPTQENLPLKSIEFFLKFRIVEPIAFVRNLGASNFDLVLSSAVQDAIRQRSRLIQAERAYDLRGSDVGDMQEALNRLLQRYGVQIIGANIPDVQLPDQYQKHLATREQVSKELAAYEREWELVRRQRMDTALMEIERAKKVRDAKMVEVKTSMNEAREQVAKVLQEQETEAQKIRWEIEARGKAALKSAENEAKALRHLGKAYQDNRAVLQYELALRRLEVAEHLAAQAPRPLLVNNPGTGDQSALSTLLLAQFLPGIINSEKAMKPGGDIWSQSEQESGPDAPLPDKNLLQGLLRSSDR
jgi:regulator of protease activity HflC (stomatin/prohibitin superfamily)